MERSLFTIFRNASIQIKLIVTFGLFFVIPLLASSAVLYLTTAGEVTSREFDRSQETLLLLQKSVESRIQEFADRTEEIYYDQRIFSPFQGGVPAHLTGLQLFGLSQALESFRAGQNYLDSIYLFLTNGQYAFTDTATDGRIASIYLAHPEWGLAINDAAGRVKWVASISIEKDSNRVIRDVSFGRVIRNIYSGRFFEIGTLLVNINTRLFDDLSLSGEREKVGFIFITDANNRLIWTTDRAWYKRDVAKSQVPARIESGDKTMLERVRLGHRWYFAARRTSLYNGWKYFAVIPEGEVLRQATILRDYFLGIVLLCTLFFGLGAVVISRYIATPLQRLIVAMNEMGRGATPSLPHIERTDEIGFLYQSFNSMFARNKNLIAQIELSHRNERTYEMRALQAQINPHFLYNTIDAINWLARERGQAQISKLLTSLSRILQYAIRTNDGMVRWRDELQWLSNYVFIQQTRFEGKFEVRYEVDEGILDFRTFHLLLQPFVENSIIHGFRDLDEGGLITVRGNRIDGRVIFEILDNGRGVSAQSIEAAFADSGTGLGIANVNERIQLNFGPSYGVVVAPGEPSGTRVVITFPALSVEDA